MYDLLRERVPLPPIERLQNMYRRPSKTLGRQVSCFDPEHLQSVNIYEARTTTSTTVARTPTSATNLIRSEKARFEGITPRRPLVDRIHELYEMHVGCCNPPVNVSYSLV